MSSSPRPRSLRTLADLAQAGLIDSAEIDDLSSVAARYAIAITPAMQELIDPEDADDPIARQFVPSMAENEVTPQELTDPIGDEAFSPVKGIVHRYPDRVLLKPILHCPVYCRFCFRREIVGQDEAVLDDAALNAALDYIRSHSEIWEVILTGGDPLMLPPARIAVLIRALSAIPHVSVIRLHSRVPVTDPKRVTPAMIEALQCDEAMIYLAVHTNHAKEFSSAAQAACRMLRKGGIALLGQTVLLRGINDDAATLEALLRACVANGIKPYYLHHGDLARGTGHFRTTIAHGQDLMRALRGRLSGLCQPTYILDIPGGHGKVPIGPDYLDKKAGLVYDWRGNPHIYDVED